MSFEKWCNKAVPEGALADGLEDLITVIARQAWNAALDEAAKLCEVNSDTYKALGRPDCAQAMKGCATGIRDMTSSLRMHTDSDANG